MSKAQMKRISIFLLALGMLMLQGLPKPASGAAISVIVPYSTTPVADSDLDGAPDTGAWEDANSYIVDLENAHAAPYGTATIYFKHDGTYIYIRIDGKIDVPWISETSDHFWLGFQINPPSLTGHHKSAQDTIFFGETYYSGVTYPLSPIDTHGGGRPPTKDASQDAYGSARYTGTSAPYDFTAEWKRKLDTGDVDDLTLVTDGTTTYFFYVTTDSNGGGSSGGAINHKNTYTDNTMKLAPPAVPEFPLGFGLFMAMASSIPLVYLWQGRRKVKGK